mgnify:CR=1 FL=1|jgi:hypothetical protein
MKKWIVLSLFLCLFLIGCSTENYCEADFLGRTSAQIVAEFGAFDCVGTQPDTDGLYRSTSCGYTIRETRAGFLGTDPEVLFFISFDENGIAVDCYEGYRPGG